MSKIPPYLKVSEVAQACGQSTRRMRRRLTRAGIAEQPGGPGSHWEVGESRLRERFPDVYDRVFEAYTQEDPGRPEETTGGQFDPRS